MKINQLRVRIMIQKAKVQTDNIGNQMNAWTDVYTCYAIVSHESPQEETANGVIYDDSKLDLTVRYCSEVSAVSSTTHRVLFQESVYAIIGVDHMQYNKNYLKLHCQKVER